MMSFSRKQIAGEMRRSAAISTFGPGAIVDIRSSGATLSGVHCGLEEWSSSAPLDGEIEYQVVYERRLQKALSVDFFRLPPVYKTDYLSGQLVAHGGLVLRRFPDWLQCPKCHVLRPSKFWNGDDGKIERFCAGCSPARSRKNRVYVIPSRFISACVNGHLSDFPWMEWISHSADCRRSRNLSLNSVAAGLAGLVVSCNDCKQSATLKSAFAKTAFSRFSCSGERPWLRSNETTPCGCSGVDGSYRALQRGASNVYYPVIESALDIPPWSSRVVRLLQNYWDDLEDRETFDQRVSFIESIRTLRERLERAGMTVEQCVSEFESVLAASGDSTSRPMKFEEYKIFESGLARDDTEFKLVQERVPNHFDSVISTLSRVPRLREVRAIKSFSRITPLQNDNVSRGAALSESPLNWLPATEIKGEGLYFGFNQSALQEWESRDGVQSRTAEVASYWIQDWQARNPEAPIPFEVTPRKLLIHTTAHMLIKQLALESGYDAASIRERVFDDTSAAQAGVLIFTGSNDSDGTLGGLQSAGSSENFQLILEKAIAGNRWCVSDPLCVHGDLAIPESFSVASCHGCVMLPESSCETFNHFLDRAMVVGTPEDPTIGYFAAY